MVNQPQHTIQPPWQLTLMLNQSSTFLVFNKARPLIKLSYQVLLAKMIWCPRYRITVHVFKKVVFVVFMAINTVVTDVAIMETVIRIVLVLKQM